MKRARMMLGLLIVSVGASVLFLASASAQAPEPLPAAFALREIIRNPEGSTYVDERGIRRTGAVANAWVLSAPITDRTLAGGVVLTGALTQYAFDCDARTSQPLRLAIVAPNYAVSEAPSTVRPAQPVAAPFGDTLDLVCGLRANMPGAQVSSLSAAIARARDPSAPAIAPTQPVPLPVAARLAHIGGDVMDGSAITYFYDETSRRGLDRRAGWIFAAFTEDRALADQMVSSMWLLVEANCSAHSSRQAGSAAIGPDLSTAIYHVMSTTAPARPAPEGSAGRLWLNHICGTAAAPAGARYASGADAVRAVRAAAR